MRSSSKTNAFRSLAIPTLTAVFGVGMLGACLAQTAANMGYGLATASNIQSANSASQFSASTVRNRILQSSVRGVGSAGVNQINFLGSGNGNSSLAGKSKPFSSIATGPSVSPYLSLSSPFSSSSDYYNVVRPQQQQTQQRQQAYTRQRKLNQLAARGPYSITGDEEAAPTGHVAVFQSLGSYQNTGGYYPQPSRPKSKSR